MEQLLAYWPETSEHVQPTYDHATPNANKVKNIHQNILHRRANDFLFQVHKFRVSNPLVLTKPYSPVRLASTRHKETL